MEILKFTPFDSSISLSLGQQCQYICQHHPSIGLTNDFNIEHNNILQLVDSQIVLVVPISDNKPRPGGDKGTKTYLFEAIDTGTTTLTINTYEKGNLTRSHAIELTIQ
jgi:hypothetical protein